MNVSLPEEYLNNPKRDLIPIEVASIDVKNIYGINGDLESYI